MILFLQVFLGFLPKNRVGHFLRLNYWKLRLKNKTLCYFGHQATIVGHLNLKLGKNFTLGDFSSLEIGQSKPVFIGNEVAIARNCYLRSANHKFQDRDMPIRLQGHESKTIIYNSNEYSIVIEDDVWIGASCIILSGTHLGTGCVVAAGTVLSGRYDPFSIIVGNPGRKIGVRN